MDLERFLIPPDFAFDVECDGGTHPLHVVAGRIIDDAHGEEEHALEALGGAPQYECLRWSSAIRMSPTQLINGEMLIQRGRKNMTGVLAVVARAAREPLIDVAVVPPPFRRLGVLSKTWTDCMLRQKNIIRSVVGGFVPFGHGVRRGTFVLHEEPGVIERSASRDGPVLRFAEDWLATVFLFGFSEYEDALTLGMRFEGDDVVLTQLAEDRSHSFERTIPVSELRPFRLLAEARV